MESSIKFQEEMIKIIGIFFPQAKIYLFGSYARGTNKPGSDIDIAIDNEKKLTIHELSLIKNLISALPMAQTVDVVCMHTIPEKMKEIILKEGIIWKS